MVLTITAKQENAIELAYLFNKHTNRPQQPEVRLDSATR